MVDQFGNWRPDFHGQQPYMDPQFIRLYGQPPGHENQQGTQQQPSAPAAMTRPTIHAEIIQVSNGESGEREVAQYPVGVGQSQMFMTQDESLIFVKEAAPSGYTINVFAKRPPAPEAAPFNPAEYVRLTDLPGLIAKEVQTAVAAIQTVKPTRAKKETETAE